MGKEFFEAIKAGRSDEVQQLLASNPGLIHEKENGLSPIMVAAYYHEPQMAELLARKTVNLTIFEASATGSTSQLIRLLARDPDLVNAYAGDGFQPLGLAAFFGQRDAAGFLIRAGANVNSPARNDMRVAPLQSSAAGRHPKIVTLLLENGADPNAREQGGFTALHAAAQNGDLESIRALIFHGADLDLRTDDGKRAVDLAVQAGLEAAASLLREAITRRFRKTRGA